MSKAYTRISSLAVCGDNMHCHRHAECQAPKHELFEVDEIMFVAHIQHR